MASKTLVAYATRYGCTRQIAERVADVLREKGQEVDIQEASAVADLGPYSAVVVGSPLYIGKMLKDATAFLERHQAALEKLPVALFTPGPVRGSDDMDEARKQLGPVLAKIAWLEPKAVEMFVGSYDPAKLRGLDKLVTKPKASPLYGIGACDDRNWAAIEAWAASLPEVLV
jgi:menaquinone-dependent protoporphyrinogen oxidase